MKYIIFAYIIINLYLIFLFMSVRRTLNHAIECDLFLNSRRRYRPAIGVCSDTDPLTVEKLLVSLPDKVTTSFIINSKSKKL